MNQDEKLKKIADHYGFSTQISKLAEECAEFSSAVHKYNVFMIMMANDHNPSYCVFRMYEAQKEFFREFADVLVVLKQIEYLLEKNPLQKQEIQQFMNEKIDRQLKRIEEEKKQ